MKNLILCLILIINVAHAQSNVAFLDAPKTENSFVKFEVRKEANKSFELVGGMIFIEANVNGKVGNFILDTGAPGVILNHKPVKKSENLVAGGINGTLEIGEVAINKFEWGIINLSNFTGYALDISHLEESFDRKIAGLIGFDVLADFELLFDYEKREVQILNARRNSLHKNNQPLQKISFQKQGHLPVIKAKIGKKTYRFGVDTGAEVNLLDKSILADFNHNLATLLPNESIQGLENNTQLVSVAQVHHTEVQSNDFPDMKYLFVDFSAVNHDRAERIDGLLGFPFLERSKVSINYKKQKIYIWE
ncbi:MAG: putative aspartyl protease [Paraglaciecola sp.]|jgi:predicted aspartyl protease